MNDFKAEVKVSSGGAKGTFKTIRDSYRPAVPSLTEFPGSLGSGEAGPSIRDLVAANYRAACRSRSKAEFIAKIGIVVEEIDETLFWLELLVEAGIVPKKRMAALLAEANELLAIFAASQHTAKMQAPPMNQ